MGQNRIWILTALFVFVFLAAACSPQGENIPASGSDAGTDSERIQAGEEVFMDQCSACHQTDGAGLPPTFPALAGNAFVVSSDPTPVIQTVLHGRGVMPPFNGVLTDEQIAAVVSFIRNSWNNQASTVAVEQVQAAR